MVDYPVINGLITQESIDAEKRRLGAPCVRVRVESGGDFSDTRLVVIEADGTEHHVYPVIGIDIQIRAPEANVARVTFTHVEVDVVAKPDTTASA